MYSPSTFHFRSEQEVVFGFHDRDSCGIEGLLENPGYVGIVRSGKTWQRDPPPPPPPPPHTLTHSHTLVAIQGGVTEILPIT